MYSIPFDTDLQALLPPWYREVLDYQAICQTEQQQFEALAFYITSVADNFFFQTMDESAVSQWEQIFNILPNPQTETLSFRQARLINRISTKPPFTLRFLYQKLDELIGPGQWEVTVDYANYTLYIKSAAQNQSYATEVAYTINKIKPAHIVYVNTPYLETPLQLSETISQYNRQFNYALGSWAIGELPFATDTLQGVIKLPSTPSIQDAMLNDVATFTSSDIAYVQVNGSINIEDISKSVQDNVCTVTYTIQPSQTDQITSLALVRADGTVLTLSPVYVPVTQNVLMSHTIPVSEGVTTVNG